MEALRIKLRRFESNFEKQHGRKPTEKDISSLVRWRTYYENYEKLKLESHVSSPERRMPKVLVAASPNPPTRFHERCETSIVKGSPLRTSQSFITRHTSSSSKRPLFAITRSSSCPVVPKKTVIDLEKPPMVPGITVVQQSASFSCKRLSSMVRGDVKRIKVIASPGSASIPSPIIYSVPATSKPQVDIQQAEIAPPEEVKSIPPQEVKMVSQKKVIKQSTENFVRLNLKQNCYKPKKKGGSAKSKLNRDRKDFAQTKEDDQVHKPTRDPLEKNLKTVMDNLDTNHTVTSGAPECPGHLMPCVIGVVKKKNRNHGKEFYKCSFASASYDKRRGLQISNGCGFFMWKEDTEESVAKALTETHQKVVLKKKTLSELKSELRMRNQPLKGTKEDLTERIQDCIASELKLMNEYRATMDVENVLQNVFHLESFRGDQRWAIDRVLKGESSLLVQATGTGKSLCYQLPAMLLPGLTVVISPLISLMEDQLASLPSTIRGACLSSTQTGAEIARTIRDVKENKIKILFISPERLFTVSFQRLVHSLPPVSLLCVDEAHCISSWSHNFRPSYLRLRDNTGLNPRCVLALTATATDTVAKDVCKVLSIDGIRMGSWIRDNITYHATQCEPEKRMSIVSKMLEDGGALAKPNHVILYVRTQHETVLWAEQLGSRDISIQAYHGGMNKDQRDKAQKAFQSGRCRVIVATVAFGMGIDKSNIRGIIHIGLPSSLEDYVQETGRAGRDGKPASCFAFFDMDDARRRQSLAAAECIDKWSIMKLLEHLASKEPLVVAEMALKMDVKPAHVDTLLVYLSLEGLINLSDLQQLMEDWSDVLSICDKLFKQIKLLEDNVSMKIQQVHSALVHLEDEKDQGIFVKILSDYFEDKSNENVQHEIQYSNVDKSKALLVSDFKNLLGECHFPSGRSMARIMQGISSPNFPAKSFNTHRLWKTRCDFSLQELSNLGELVLQQHKKRIP